VGEALAAVVRRVAAPAVDLDVPDRRFAPEIESTLYFAVCEALANAVKHARADRVRVSVRAVPDGIVAEVSDDGVGLPARPPRRPPGESGGLTGVQDRVAALRGRVEITGGPGTGTTVRITLPEITR
jgi:signal transduction histidine kinase